MNTSFNSDLVLLLGSAGDEFDNVVEVKKNPPQQNQNTFNRKEASAQVEDIEPSTISTPFRRKSIQNRCLNRCSNRLRNLW